VVFFNTVGTITAVLRDCNNSIPLDVAAQASAIITNHCVRSVFNYFHKPFDTTLKADATVCPCRTELCNAGNISLNDGVTATTGSFVTSSTTDNEQVVGGSPTKMQDSLLVFIVATVFAVVYVHHR